jgi:hypothetical protein
MLRDPGKTDLLYGFEDNTITQHVVMNDVSAASLLATNFDAIYRLAEAIGCVRVRKPENTAEIFDVDNLLRRIDDALGIEVDFPNPYPGETGLKTDRGIVTYRATHALYQAWRICSQVTGGGHDASVVEIGAGSGRTAYYSTKMGIRDYTIVDLPLTCVASANFLGRTIGDDKLSLYGEGTSHLVKITPPAEFLSGVKIFDVLINVDSLTEMDKETAKKYIDYAIRFSKNFISINHEGNEFSVKELIGTASSVRFPYWMRPGYVEEIISTQLAS